MRVLALFVILLPQVLYAQHWIDTVHSIALGRDSVYGTAVDFAGNVRSLALDVAYPVGDTAPGCGRPLIVVLYGGAWMGGSKEVNEVQTLMHDFAKRGYVAVAPNYRLGMFQTAADRNCNIGAFGLEWNCLNIQDTAEWYRAYYRAIQDVRGAIRYMVQRKDQFDIDPQNVFVAGFSAGGFTALGVGFLDHPSEWRSFAGGLPAADRPNTRYDLGCVQKFQWDTSVAHMELNRPDLGTIDGPLNPGADYKIRAIGNFYGGMFYNLLDSGTSDPPAIYGYHQPNDLIVPYQANQTVFQGYSACAYTFCNMGIINRPYVSSSPVIRDWARTAPDPVDFHFDSTLNYTNCAGQIADPSKGGHQLDHWGRTWNMAQFFATKIDTSACLSLRVTESVMPNVSIWPNPSTGVLQIESNEEIASITMCSAEGKVVWSADDVRDRSVHMDQSIRTAGVYVIQVRLAGGSLVRTRWIKFGGGS